MIRFRRIAHLLKETKLFQDNVEQAVKQINDEPFVGGRLITVTRGNTDQFEVVTGLTRKVKGWVLTDTTVSVTFYRVTSSRDANGILTLKPDAAGTYTFWVF